VRYQPFTISHIRCLLAGFDIYFSRLLYGESAVKPGWATLSCRVLATLSPKCDSMQKSIDKKDRIFVFVEKMLVFS